MSRVVFLAAALAFAPVALWGQELPRAGKTAASSEQTDSSPRSALKERVAQALDEVADACASDIDDFCGRVTSGQGRLAFCMLAHEDQLGSKCRSALYDVSRDVSRNIERVAEGCLGEIKTLCGETGKIGQCVGQKKGSLSPACQTIVEAVGQRARKLVGMVGAAVYSSDNKNLGQVVDVTRGPDNKVQSIQVDVGRVLGLGTKIITVNADKLERLPGFKLLMSETEVRALPEVKK